MKKIIKNFSKDQIIAIINKSNTYDEALISFGYKPNVANRKVIKELAMQYNLTLDHFINGQTINLLGQNFGRLKVIKKVASKGNGARWLCQCNCGNMTEVDANHLRRGNISSCGCLQSEKVTTNNYNKLIDLTGQRFGKLLVLQRANNIGLQPAWICKCDCGTITHPILGSNLRRGVTKSCGCLRSKGEEKIAKILSNNNIPFIREYILKDCTFSTGGHPKMDFAVLNANQEILYFIEYQGEQHYQPRGSIFTEEKVKIIQQRDKEKLLFCQNKNIPILYIKYDKYNTLELQDLQIDVI